MTPWTIRLDTTTTRSTVALTHDKSVILLQLGFSRGGRDWRSRVHHRGAAMAQTGLAPGTRVQRCQTSRSTPAGWKQCRRFWRVWAGGNPLNRRHRILPQHSRTLRHELWACKLDVHDDFLASLRLRKRLRGTLGAPNDGHHRRHRRHRVRPRRERSHSGTACATRSSPRPQRRGLGSCLTSETRLNLSMGDLVRLIAAFCANETLAPMFEMTGLQPISGAENLCLGISRTGACAPWVS